jgi:hypothetical protein
MMEVNDMPDLTGSLFYADRKNWWRVSRQDPVGDLRQPEEASAWRFLFKREAAEDKPVLVEILAYAPTVYYHCTHCEISWREMGMSNRIHAEQLESSLPADIAEEFGRVSLWAKELALRHCGRVLVKVVDAASLEGVFKSLRYRQRRFPYIVVDRQQRYQVGELHAAALAVENIVQGQGKLRRSPERRDLEE